MLKTKFVKGLDAWYKDGNEVKTEEVMNWVDRCQISPEQLQILYEEIIENYKYKTFPTLAEIKKFWENIYLEKPTTETLDIIRQRNLTKSWDIRKLIRKLSEIRKKLRVNFFSEKILESHEIDFCHQWSCLWSEYQILQDSGITGYRMEGHLEAVKEYIIKNMKFASAAKNLVNEEIKQERTKEINQIGAFL